jgi:hypothetical protein
MDDSEPMILKKISFLQIQDSELGVGVWYIEEEYFGVCLSSVRTFENLPDALRHYLESLENDHGESYH